MQTATDHDTASMTDVDPQVDRSIVSVTARKARVEAQIYRGGSK